MRSFASLNAHMSAVHGLIPGGAHTYAKGDGQYLAGLTPVTSAAPDAGCGTSTAASTLSSAVACAR